MTQFSPRQEAFYDKYIYGRPIPEYDRIYFKVPYYPDSKRKTFKKNYRCTWDPDNRSWYLSIFSGTLHITQKAYKIDDDLTSGEAMARMKVALEHRDAGFIERVFAVDEAFPERTWEEIHQAWEEMQQEREEAYC